MATMTETAAITQLLTPRSDDPQRAWDRQRLLRIGQDAGWFTYLCDDGSTGRYVVTLPDGTVRDLVRNTLTRQDGGDVRRDEPTAWMIGQAYGHGAADGIIEQLGPLPQLYDRPTAAQHLGISEITVGLHARNGKIRALHYGGRRILYFADQIHAIATGTDTVRWENLRFLLPPSIRPHQITYTPTPGPDPLPVPYVHYDHGGQRNLDALAIAEKLRWLTFTASHDGRYHVIIDGRALELPAAAVLPFLWGFGDARGQGAKVAYR